MASEGLGRVLPNVEGEMKRRRKLITADQRSYLCSVTGASGATMSRWMNGHTAVPLDAKKKVAGIPFLPPQLKLITPNRR